VLELLVLGKLAPILIFELLDVIFEVQVLVEKIAHAVVTDCFVNGLRLGVHPVDIYVALVALERLTFTLCLHMGLPGNPQHVLSVWLLLFFLREDALVDHG